MEWRTFDMEWIPIKGYKYPYRINEDPRVQKFDQGKWVDLIPQRNKKNGRLVINMRKKDGKRVRVALNLLVANAFLGGRKPGYNIVPKNGMLTDCAPENLEFVTLREIGKRTKVRKPVLKVDENGEVLAVYPNLHAAAVANYMGESAVKNRCYGRIQNPFRGYDFTFVYDE